MPLKGPRRPKPPVTPVPWPTPTPPRLPMLSKSVNAAAPLVSNSPTYNAYVPDLRPQEAQTLGMASPTTPVVPAAPGGMYQSIYGYGYQQPAPVAAPMGTQGMTGVNSGTPFYSDSMAARYNTQQQQAAAPGQPFYSDSMAARYNPYTQSGAAAPAGPAMPQSWEDRFYAEHGRYPDEDDVNDRLWSESFYRDNGRPPNMDEWTYHYYETHGFPGGGGAAGSAATAEALPANLRGWGSWLREMVEQNKGINISNPFYRTGKAGQEAITDVADNGKPLAGYNSSNDVLGQLRALLGIQAAAGDNNTTVWQKIINALPSASLEAQQLINSLRYDSNTNQWYSIDTTQLANPSYT